jgi:hypothetical protein
VRNRAAATFGLLIGAALVAGTALMPVARGQDGVTGSGEGASQATATVTPAATITPAASDMRGRRGTPPRKGRR